MHVLSGRLSPGGVLVVIFRLLHLVVGEQEEDEDGCKENKE